MRFLLTLFLVCFFSFITKAQTTAIPDPNFEQALINLGYDSGPIDGTVLTANIDTITNLSIQGGMLPGLYISDLTGIEDFTALTFLSCHSNTLNSLDLSHNNNLSRLYCENNQLTNLNVSQNISLTFLKCDNNQLPTLDITQNTDLTYLNCSMNLLSSLDVTQNTLIDNLICENNQLTSLDVSQNTVLNSLLCAFNQLTLMNFSQNTNLRLFYGQNNQLTDLDFSQNLLFRNLWCQNNQLTCLNVKNGNNNNFINFNTNNNPSLTCIEVDNAAYSTTNWTSIDPQTSFSTNCVNPCTVGIEKNFLSNMLVYPNPTTGLVSIDLEKLKTNLSVTLTNSVGQVILTKNYESTDFINLDIYAPSGIYFLQLEMESETVTKKLIKK